MNESNYNEDFIKLCQKAKRGDAESQYQVGKHYYDGDIVEQDYFQALRWFGRAAERNHSEALSEYDLARHDLTKAAEQGDSISQYRLGKLYSEENRWVEAVICYRRASAQGHKEAIKELGVDVSMIGSEDDSGVVYSTDGEVLLWCKNENLTYYSVKSDCKRIAKGAFAGCCGLKSVHIPEGVKLIDTYAFAGCEKFQSLHIPSSMEKIGVGAFYHSVLFFTGKKDYRIMMYSNVYGVYNCEVWNEWKPRYKDDEWQDNHRDDDIDWLSESWEAMTDGMYGDMPDGFDGDYGFLGR